LIINVDSKIFVLLQTVIVTMVSNFID